MTNANEPKPGGFAELLAASYPTLRRIAFAKARSTTVNPSSLAQDAVCRLLRLADPPRDAQALEGVAWQLMDWLIKDQARSNDARRKRERNGAEGEGHRPDTLSDPRLDATSRAFRELAELSPRKAEAMMLSAVCQLSMERIAQILDVSTKTVQRDLEFARAWMAAQTTERVNTAPDRATSEAADERR